MGAKTKSIAPQRTKAHQFPVTTPVTKDVKTS